MPVVTISAAATEDGRIALTGTFVDYANADKYYEVTAHGLVCCTSSRLGKRTLTVNTSGRTRVNFSGYKANGSYTFNLTPSGSTTEYVVRAYLAYKDEDGNTKYAYSDMITVSLSELQN